MSSKNNEIRKKTILVFFAFLILGCSQSYQPKPKAYNQIYLPVPKYNKIEVDGAYVFESNTYAKKSENKEYGWLNLSYFKHSAEMLITYKKINSKEHLESLVNESFKLISKHQNKASSIIETEIKTLSGKSATIIDIKGEEPPPFQFIITDSSKNFMRAALYFEKPIKGDSLLPVVDYIKKDMLHILNTLSWNE